MGAEMWALDSHHADGTGKQMIGQKHTPLYREDPSQIFFDAESNL